MIDNILEEVARWQQHDEDRNLELVSKHEAETTTEAEAAHLFQREVERRQSNDS